MLTVYIAGPYTEPDPCENTHKAIEVADKIVKLGAVPFVPHLSHFWHTMSPKPYKDWLGMDIEWLLRCDVLYRIAGVSAGADKEFSIAIKASKPCFVMWEDLAKYIKSHKSPLDRETLNILRGVHI